MRLQTPVPDTRLFPLEGGARHHPDVDGWFDREASALRAIARRWFDEMRAAGPDVLDLLHDGHPTACVGTLAFGYVNAFREHVNVGFFLGAILNDPAGLLQGTGRYMRHVKIRPGDGVDDDALRRLIRNAYADMRGRQILAAFFAAINRNDMEAMAAFFDPEIVRVEPEGFPTAGTYRGSATVKEHVATGRGTWAEGTCEPERILVHGDMVVVYLHVRVRLKDATDWIDGRFADGFVLRDGKITEFRTFGERADALRWARIEDRE